MEDTQQTVGLTQDQEQYVHDVDVQLLRKGYDVLEREKNISSRESLKTHWPGVWWSAVLSLSLVMESFDTGMINSYYGQPAFARRFGTHQPDGSYAVTAVWQTTISNVGSVGQLLGVSIVASLQDRYGNKKTFIGGMVAMALTIFLCVFAQSIGMLLAAEFLMGVPWGMFQTLSTAYAAEITPINLRGVLTSFVNICWATGFLISAGVVLGSLSIVGDWSWRMPYVVQWVWPIPLGIAAFYAPESPWWYVRKGRFDEAKHSLRRLARRDFYTEEELDAYVAVLKHTDDLERAESSGGSYLECFRGTNRRRTEIMIGTWLCQIWCGNWITGYAVDFLENAGLTTGKVFDINMGIKTMNVLGTAANWFIQPYFGRRPQYFWGLVLQLIFLIVVGILGVVPQTPDIPYGVAALLMLLIGIFAVSVGPLCYTIAGELPSTRLRSRSIVIGRFCYNISGIINGFLVPYQLTTTGWDWGAKAGFFWAGTCLLCCVWCWFRLPETGGLTYAELDILFANKVNTRQFTKVKIQDYAADGSFENTENEKKESEAAHIENRERPTAHEL